MAVNRSTKPRLHLSYSENLGLMAKIQFETEQKNKAVENLAKDIQRTPDEQKWYQYNDTVEVSVSRDDNNQLFLNIFSSDEKHEDGNLKVKLKDKSGLFTELLNKKLDANIRRAYLKKARVFIESAFQAFS